MKKLSEKQRQYIDEHRAELSSRAVAKRLNVSKKRVDDYIGRRSLSRSKKVSFTVILVLVPLFLLAAVEVSLRLVGYGQDLHLIITREKAGKKYYALNPEVGKKYFSSAIGAIPEVYEETFAYQKPANGYRIFCLGGSTTASFPYELNARFHRLLYDRLKTQFPERPIEVINVGMSAVNSYTVLDFVRELVHYKPDLFLLYMGHNEFYGALGVGSTQYLGRNRTIVEFYLWLQRFKTFQLLHDAISGLRSMFSPSRAQGSDQTLMERMVRDSYIALYSPEYRKAAAAFRENLVQVLELAKKNETRILVSTVVSNLRDHEPFHSLHGSITAQQKTRWDALFLRGSELQSRKAYRGALEFYHEAAAIDTTPARVHFAMGQCYEALGRFGNALTEFQKARDLDALRFRASSDFNKIIERTCKELNVPLVAMGKAFADRSPHGIVGHELIAEHLHPNFKGYFLMAKTFCQAMAQNGFLAPAESWSPERGKTDAEYMELSGVTELDREIGALKIRRLTSRWPFRAPVEADPELSADPAAAKVRQVTADYVRGKLSWNDAHYALAEYHASQGRYARAAREYKAVIKVLPDNYYAYFKLGELFFGRDDYEAARVWLEKAVHFDPQSPSVYAKLATVYVFLKLYDNAVASYSKALDLNKESGEFSTLEVAQAQYYKAISHIQLGQRAQAVEALSEVIRLQPGNEEAKRLVSLLQSNADVHLQFTN